MKFEEKNYSLNIDEDYGDLDVIKEIESIIPSIRDSIISYYKMYQNNDLNKINSKDLFAKTMYIHQVHKLREKDKLNNNDISILNDSIKYLRKIQVEFICDAASINRFNVMFKSKYDEQNNQNIITNKENH